MFVGVCCLLFLASCNLLLILSAVCRRSLFVVCDVLSVLCCLLFGVCCVVFVVCGLLFVC